MRLRYRPAFALLAAGLLGVPLAAQQPASPPAPPAATPLAVGTVAPDFSLPAATIAGVGAQPARLSDYKGKTVVLAFFFRARTKG
jgi:peroxiredoxin Q/BCP